MSDITAPQPNPRSVPVIMSANELMQPSMFQTVVSMGQMMAKSSVSVPNHLRGKPEDCAAVCMQAMQWGLNPYSVAQKTYMTPGGSLGYESQLLIAVINALAPIQHDLKFEFFGDWTKILGKVKEMKGDKGKYYGHDWNPDDEKGLGVRVWSTKIGDTEPSVLEVLLMQCYPRFSTQWATDPQQQIIYAGARKWGRRFTPGVILGVYAPEELEYVQVERDITPGAAQPPTTPAGAAQQAASASPQTVEELGLSPADLAKRAAIIASLEKYAVGHTPEQFRQHWNTTPAEDRRLIGIPHPVGIAERTRIAAMAGSNVIDAEPPKSSASSDPGFPEALSAVQSGDFDLARDIGRSLSEGQRNSIEAAIANAQAQGGAQ
ncbi:RecT family recombinase [Uliginosibacterium sediminicola]|uniref:RecT family recombinase n=1 Tax=Uliginosibacterium sediminicola TaxID=2024550 RepID=A0ABU9YW15_9RHOO